MRINGGTSKIPDKEIKKRPVKGKPGVVAKVNLKQDDTYMFFKGFLERFSLKLISKSRCHRLSAILSNPLTKSEKISPRLRSPRTTNGTGTQKEVPHAAQV